MISYDSSEFLELTILLIARLQIPVSAFIAKHNCFHAIPCFKLRLSTNAVIGLFSLRLVKRLKCDLVSCPRTLKESLPANRSSPVSCHSLLSRMILSMLFLVDLLVGDVT